MLISEIVVGKRYRFISDFEHTRIMLGVGMRKLWTDNEFTEKHLVFIKSNESTDIGKMMQEGENVHEGIWDKIVEEDSDLYAF
jgi:hypothetical protein